MTAAYDRTQATILELVEEWEPLLDLPGISVEHRFLPTTCDGDDDKVVDTHTTFQYRRAQIRWWLGRASVFDSDALEGLLVHEYVHILLGAIEDRLKPGSDLFLEVAVENVARALLKASA